jgi:hypothetical protein
MPIERRPDAAGRHTQAVGTRAFAVATSVDPECWRRDVSGQDACHMTTWFWIWVGVTAVSLGGLWLAELPELRKVHARRQVALLNAVRLGAAAALFVVLTSVANPRTLAGVAIATVAIALVLVPIRWVVGVGGIEPKWELRALQDAAGELTRRCSTLPKPPEFQQSMARLVGRMKAVKSPELAEMRDLLVADFSDSIVGLHHFNDLGLRAIRMHQIECKLFGPQARRGELDPAEATSRWRLYRTVGDMIDCGSAAREPEHLARLRQLIEELGEYRRPHTEELIDALQGSAREWLASGTPDPWPDGGVLSLGPTVERSYGELWPRYSVFWGAQLDDRDLSNLPTVMTARQLTGT